MSAPTIAQRKRGASPQRASADEELRQFSFVGKHQILRRLGGGGMGDVYLSRATLHGGTEKLVALKTVRASQPRGSVARKLFLPEAKISLGLQHANVVQVFDFGEAGGRHFLAMEFIHGRDVFAIIEWLREHPGEPRGPLAVAIALEITRALDYIHGKESIDGKPLRLVHRDISPGNVIVSLHGEVKVLDFGVAATTAWGRPDQLLVGKAAYAAPEQLTGDSPDPGWDLYALGAMLFEIITLRKLFPGETDGEVLASRALPPTAASEVFPYLPPTLDRLITRAIHPDARRRFRRASELRDELLAATSLVGPCDLGKWMRRAFGAELTRERERDSFLVLRARNAPPSLTEVVSHARGLTSALHRGAARRILLALGLVLALGAAGLGVREFRAEQRREQELAACLKDLDQHLIEGRLAGPGEEHALGKLAQARRFAPDSEALTARQRLLEATFERLADAARLRRDHGEAAVHLEALLSLAPTSVKAREALAEVEQSLRQSAGSPLAEGGAR